MRVCWNLMRFELNKRHVKVAWAGFHVSCEVRLFLNLVAAGCQTWCFMVNFVLKSDLMHSLYDGSSSKIHG